jgi:hypothetical protein
MPISTISIDELTGINDTMSSLDLSSSPNTIDTITLTSLPYIYSEVSGATLTVGSNLSNNVWTTSTNGTSAANLHQSGMLSLQGEKADIDINGVSLMKTLTSIQERLNILTPAPELEKDWDQLRELGEQYRKLEAEFEEKSKMWKTLKAMPPPEIE